MIHFSRAGMAVSAAALFTANTAFADVTAQDVLDAWKTQVATNSEVELTIGSETMDGNTLRVTDIMATSVVDGMKNEAGTALIEFVENGDGTVTINLPEPYTMSMGDEADFAANHTILELALQEIETVVSGDKDNMTFVTKGPRLSLTPREVVVDGAPTPGTGSLVLNEVAATTTMARGDMQSATYEASAASADVTIHGEDDTSTFDLTGSFTDIAITGSTEMPMDYDAATDMVEGVTAEGGMTTAGGNFVVAIVDEAGQTDVTYTTGGTEMSYAINDSQVSFDTLTKSLAVTAMGGAVPLPVDVGLGEFGLSFAFPAAATEEAAPFALGLNISDLTISEMIWGMIDPAAALPHDPITLQIGLSGTGKVDASVFSGEMPAEAMGQPGELESLSLDNLKIAIAGAMLTGEGAFTFDATDMETFGGFPAPEGAVTLVGTGINGLLDKVQQMGLPIEEQLMGARMMLGMFATVTGDDQLESKVEVTADGQVLVNGQRIK